MSTLQSIAWDIEQERCAEARTVECEECGDHLPPRYAYEVRREAWLCRRCVKQCRECGESRHPEDLKENLCEMCAAELAMEEA